MTLLRLSGGVVAVLVWFALWRLVTRRVSGVATSLTSWTEALEAVGLTLFAALWFASLGHGAWWVLFVVLGLLVEGPIRLRHLEQLPDPRINWRPLLLGTLRLLGAGAVISLLL